MVDEQTTNESKDGTGAGDRNVPFEFGHPRACLTTICQARLTIMRGAVKDYLSGEVRGGAADGDMALFRSTDSGLFVPTSFWGRALPAPAQPTDQLWSDDVEMP